MSRAGGTTWLSRHKPLAVGLGCMSILVMGCLFIGGVVAAANLVLRSNDAYRLAISAVERHPVVIAKLGAPVRSGWLMSGKMETRGSTGEAALTIPISGPHGTGTVHVRAHQNAGKWTFTTLDVHFSTRSAPVDLLAAPSPP